MEAIGVLSSCVTALMKLSCGSFRRISRNRKMVLRTSPPVMAPKKITPRKTLIPSRQFRMIQPKPTATATPARPTPSTRNVIVALRRLVMRMTRFYREGKENRSEEVKQRLTRHSKLRSEERRWWQSPGARLRESPVLPKPKPTLELEPPLLLRPCRLLHPALRDTHAAPAPTSSASRCRTSSYQFHTIASRAGRKPDAHDGYCASPRQKSGPRPTNCWSKDLS